MSAFEDEVEDEEGEEETGEVAEGQEDDEALRHAVEGHLEDLGTFFHQLNVSVEVWENLCSEILSNLTAKKWHNEYCSALLQYSLQSLAFVI